MLKMKFFHKRCLVSLFFLVCSLLSVSAQLEQQEAFSQTLAKMKEREWQQALDILVPFLDQPESKTAIQTTGPKFGLFWYYKGYCEHKLNLYDESMTSFETCYKEFANTPGASSKNTYANYSLLKWADSARDAKDYDLASKLYVKFLNEKDDNNPMDNKFSKGNFYISLAICQIKSNDLKGGRDSLKTAIVNKRKFPTRQKIILTGMNTFLETAIAEKDEKAVLSFLNEFGSELNSDPMQTYKVSKKLLVRAAEATRLGMKESVVKLLASIPDTYAIINEMKATEEAFSGYKGKRPVKDGILSFDPKLFKDQRKSIENELLGEDPNEATSLYLSALLWSANGNTRTAYAAYKELEENYRKSKNREFNLLGLIKSSRILGLSSETEKFGNKFLKAFPDSEHEGTVRSLMISSLYFSGEYEECLRIAYDQIGLLEQSKPSESHDQCLFVIAGSNHNLGKYNEATKYFEQHIAEYPKSRFIEQSEFMYATNTFRLRQFMKAGKMLDDFLVKYEPRGSNLLAYALFYRANIHYTNQESKPALDRILQMEESYISSPIMASAFNLKANILQSDGDLKRSEQYYKRALERANQDSDFGVAGESCSYLIALLNDEGQEKDRSKDAVRYYEQYWEKYADDSPLQAEVAFSGLVPMQKVGKLDEALDRMAAVIAKVAKMEGQPKLEALVNSYRDAYLEKNGFSKLKVHFYDFKGISSEDKEALAMLRISLIGAYEEQIAKLHKEKDADEILKLTASVKALFADLKNEFKPQILSAYSLGKVGDYIRTKTATPRESISYYEEILKKNDPKFTHDALFGLADLYTNSKQSAEVAKAEGYLNKVYGESKKKATKQSALSRLIDLQILNKQWSKANKSALEYLSNKKFTKGRAMVAYQYALTFDKMGDEGGAISAYNKVRSANMGYITVSAPSTLRMMEIWWKQNRPGTDKGPSTRQAAYNQGWLYLDATRRSFDKFTKDEKANWKKVEALVQKYEKSGNVRTMAQQIEDKKN